MKKIKPLRRTQTIENQDLQLLVDCINHKSHYIIIENLLIIHMKIYDNSFISQEDNCHEFDGSILNMVFPAIE